VSRGQSVERRGGDSNPRSRFTPLTGLANRSSNDASADEPRDCDDVVSSVAFYVALLNESPELAAVARAWRELPRIVKVGISAMVQAAARDRD
jgi:hypothetical protein